MFHNYNRNTGSQRADKLWKMQKERTVWDSRIVNVTILDSIPPLKSIKEEEPTPEEHPAHPVP